MTRVPTPRATPANKLAEGWNAYQAEDGSFTCAFPADSKKREVLSSALPGAYSVSFDTSKDNKITNAYTISWVLDDKADLKAAVSEFARNGQIANQKDIEFSGKKGIEATFVPDHDKVTLIVRAFPGKGRIFRSSYAAKQPQPDQARIFFESFQPNLDRPASEDPPVPIKWKEYTGEGFSCTLPEQFQASEDGAGGMCWIPGRAVNIKSSKEKGDLQKIKARLDKKDIVSQKDVEHGDLKGFEAVLRGNPSLPDFPMGSEKLETHSLFLVGSGATYLITVGGLRGDKTLEADARKIFDSFKATK